MKMELKYAANSPPVIAKLKFANIYEVHMPLNMESHISAVSSLEKSDCSSIFLNRRLLSWVEKSLIGLIMISNVCHVVAAIGQSPTTHEMAVPLDTRTADRILTKNTSGVELIRNSLGKLGDPNAVLAEQSCEIKGQVTSPGQSSVPVAWTVDADNYLSVIHDPQGTINLGSHTPHKTTKQVFFPSNRMNLIHFIPEASTEWLARALIRPTISISAVSQKKMNTRDMLVIHLADQANPVIRSESEQIWYFDSESYLPIRIDYKLAPEGRTSVTIPVHTLISSFDTFAGIQFPANLSTYVNDTFQSQTVVSSVVCSVQRHIDSYFDASHEVGK
ncbi:hypothetical protein [Granulicella sp. dw_53]|uniref:hypothetical protein n=1 Tax=Granulicella sp. dw_53 TaxID=2719792 RepID=UPI001BD3C59D|nr:hypothetical protein [Granulicella sp. dw_53]